MTNDDIVTEAIRLIKAGKKDAARSVLEPFLLKNPNHIQAWMWETELFPDDRDKVKVLEACLKRNPGQPQVIQALNILKARIGNSRQPAAPASVKPQRSASPSVKPAPSSPPFSTPPASGSIRPLHTARSTTTAVPAIENPQRPQPSNLKSTNPQNKTKRMTPKTIKAILIISACLALLVAAGLYVAGGFNLNGQVNKSFAEQNCTGVVQYTSFISYYPRWIFSSLFSGYDQYAECRFKLDIDQAIAAKNWRSAFTLAQESLATYPNGAFAAGINEQALMILSTWSEESIANQDYGNGIEKLEQLVEAYPDSPVARSAPDTIMRTSILWAKELIEKQNHEEAELHLNDALSYFQADPARSQQIKQELADLYVDWGDTQIQIGDMDNGIKHYQMAGEFSLGKVDADLLIARAYLQKAMDIADTENFEVALAKVREISDAAQAENIKSEANAAQEKILAAYSVSTSQQAMDQMTAAITLTCQGQRPELPIFGLDAEKIRFGLISFNMKLPSGWAAERPGELHYVICITEKEEEIQTCQYQGNHLFIRMRYVWQVTLNDILNGDEYDSKTFKGSNPAQCKSRDYFGATQARIFWRPSHRRRDCRVA